MSTEKFDRAVRTLIETKLKRPVDFVEETRTVGNVHHFDVEDTDGVHTATTLSAFEISKALKSLD